MTAARENNSPVVEALLAGGVQVDAKDSHGKTALMIAAPEAGPEMLRLLLQAHADPAHHDERGHTALDFAASAERFENAQVLYFGLGRE
jgi:ankyrin repeat protein